MVSYGKQSNGGWTLVEMAVVLVVSALLATAALQLLPLGTQLAEEDVAQARLAHAEQALVGYARAHHRLPSADVDGDGNEDIGGNEGWLPYATLGLPPSSAVAYSVNSALSNAVDGYLYHPDLPVTTAEATAAATSKTDAAPPVQANGLDLCVLLGNLQHTANKADGFAYASAFALSHRRPGVGIATTPLMAMTIPGNGTSIEPSLLNVATGIGELYVRLECNSRLNRAFASAQAARAAQSAYLLAELDAATADFYIKVADLEDEFNTVSIGFASFNIATAVFEVALGAAGAVADIFPPTDIAKAIISGIQAGVAAVQLGLSGLELDLARASKAESEATLAATRNHARHAHEQKERLRKLRDSATEKAQLMDRTGLNP